MSASKTQTLDSIATHRNDIIKHKIPFQNYSLAEFKLTKPLILCVNPALCLVFYPAQLLNCIMDMVEKTRRSLTVLRRCQEADREELNYWIRRYSDAEELKKGASSGQSRQQSPAAQENATSGKNEKKKN